MYLKLYVLAVITLPKEQTNERTKVQPKHEMQTWYVLIGMIRIQKLKLGCTEPKTHIKRDNHKIEYARDETNNTNQQSKNEPLDIMWWRKKNEKNYNAPFDEWRFCLCK